MVSPSFSPMVDGTSILAHSTPMKEEEETISSTYAAHAAEACLERRMK